MQRTCCFCIYQYIVSTLLCRESAKPLAGSLALYYLIHCIHSLSRVIHYIVAYLPAREKLKRLQKEGKMPMNEHIAMFKTLVTQAKIGKYEEALCDLFLETLPRKLQEQLLTLQFPLDGIKGHYEWAQKFNHQFHRMQRILGRTTQNKQETFNNWRKNKQKTEQKKEQKKPDNNSRCFTFTKKDLNTMDID